MHAVAGKDISGVTVPTKIASTSVAGIPRCFSASLAASIARSEVAIPLSTICRWRIPVRSMIHWSDVSTILSRSALVRRRGGTYVPRAEIFARTRLANEISPSLKINLYCKQFSNPAIVNRTTTADSGHPAATPLRSEFQLGNSGELLFQIRVGCGRLLLGCGSGLLFRDGIVNDDLFHALVSHDHLRRRRVHLTDGVGCLHRPRRLACRCGEAGHRHVASG